MKNVSPRAAQTARDLSGGPKLTGQPATLIVTAIYVVRKSDFV